MDRELLETMLAQGLSLGAIGQRLGRHESTVAYWLDRHGLRPVNAGRYAARGGLGREELEGLVEQGMSIAQIAAEVGRSKGTVRHWLRQYGLKTLNRPRAQRAGQRETALEAGLRRTSMTCTTHGITEFVRTSAGYYRCVLCRSAAVSKRRRKIKRVLVAEAGGCCVLCGYDRCVAALSFHHVDPAEKRFELSQRGVTRSMAIAREEAGKCVLLCSNCHAEVEAGLASAGVASAGIQCDLPRATPG
jgi:transposase